MKKSQAQFRQNNNVYKYNLFILNMYFNIFKINYDRKYSLELNKYSIAK